MRCPEFDVTTVAAIVLGLGKPEQELKTMMIHHACPRCSGTLITEAEELACLQCGARVYSAAMAGYRSTPARKLQFPGGRAA